MPCTSDLFSAYCITLIGERLPDFIADWEQGQKRYEANNIYDDFIPFKGKPKFGGWIFNGFDSTTPPLTKEKKVTKIDEYHLE